ncbi:basic helix-loop-helix (bHLH) DNA-bindingsuperfamily protein [Striga asiatica]|uniref:Basic helix-loop-helix (BHLH) DNA-bindingsuperfamily protein n=1 Tax=Striga asiatica TaxID=4170 RepID=A0A5A7QE49_STRAF|nr:basic helix-loop-helix (bHLH) DNA-bindingsuperfamily protein [Striga asiatica]
MGDPFLMQQWPHVDSIGNLSSISTNSTFSENYNIDNNQSYYNYNNNNNNTMSSHQPVLDFNNIRPSKQLKIVKDDGFSYSPPSDSVNLVNSGLLEPKEEIWYNSSGGALNFSSPESIISTGSQNHVVKRGSTGANGSRLPQDHIMAERKRREKLSQRFITLATLVPGLKKMDKASVLGDAINHIKQLQEKVKALEEQTRKKSTIESMVLVRKYEVTCAAHSSSENSTTDEQSISSGPTSTESFPEIEARFCDRDVLISIHCEKRKGVLEKTVAEIEKLHLSVVNSSIMSFGDSALNITVVAQKDDESDMSMKDLVKNLRDALKIFV